MSVALIDELHALASQLEGLGIDEGDPEIQKHMAALTKAVAAKANLSHQSTDNRPNESFATVFKDTGVHELPTVRTPQDTTSETIRSWVANLGHEMVDPQGDPELMPSANAFIMPQERRQYGIPLSGVNLLEPPQSSFLWPPHLLSPLGKPEEERLVPAPAAPCPAGQYPQAPPKYVLTKDASYRREYCYTAPYMQEDKAIEQTRMHEIQTPPNICPVKFDVDTQAFVAAPIPGMVRLPLGIPIVHLVDGDPKKAITFVCAHSLESLRQYKECAEIEEELAPRLLQLTWGTPPRGSDPGTPSLFELEGMQTNLRSKNAVAANRQPGDGSYNLASTHGEGQGHGIFMPAVQTNTPEGASRISEILRILHRMYRLIMPLCVSRFEWEMMEFNGRMNNIPSAGGFAPGPTSCQVNGSSVANVIRTPDLTTLAFSSDGSNSTELADFLKAQLADSIGPQGKNHGDFKDAPSCFTLFVLLFRLPPGSDLGPFLWNRGGIYLREQNLLIIFTSFKGVDTHCGHPPTYMQTIRDNWISMAQATTLYNLSGKQIRAGFVLYPSLTAIAHSTQLAYAPSLHFLHSPAHNTNTASQRFFATDGNTVLGDHASRSNRLGLEGIYGFANYLKFCNLNLEGGVNPILAKISYVDEQQISRPLSNAFYNLDDEQEFETVCLYQRYYAWYLKVLTDYSLGVTKTAFKKRQKEIEDMLAGEIVSRPSVLHTPHRLWSVSKRLQPSSHPSHIIAKVLSRQARGSDYVWTVLLEGSTQPQEFAEGSAPWLRSEKNQSACRDYLAGVRPTAEASPGDTSIALADETGSSAAGPSFISAAPGSETSHLASGAGLSIQDASYSAGNSSEAISFPPASTTTPNSQATARVKAIRPTGGMGSKRKRLAPLFSDSSAASESDNYTEYEVEAILKTDKQDGKQKWLVKWKGYDETHNSWEEAANLQNSRDLLDNFEGYQTPAVDSVSDADSSDEYSPQLSHPLAKKKNADITAETAPLGPLQRGEFNTSLLDRLLDTSQIRRESEALELSLVGLQKVSDFRMANLTPRDMAATLMDHIERNEEVGTGLAFQLPGWTGPLADRTLKCVIETAEDVLSFTKEYSILGILTYGLQAEVCRSLTSIYQWIINLGPSLSAHLVGIHRAAGNAGLHERFPNMAPLVHHLISFFDRQRTVATSKPLRKKTKSATQVGKPGRPRKRKAVTSAPPPSEPVEKPQQNEFAELPGNLYGLVTNGKPKPIHLKMQGRVQDEDHVYALAAERLCKLWETCLILPSMVKLDAFLEPTPRPRGTSGVEAGARARCIVRGAILQSITDVLGDGLFAAQAMRELLRQPSALFPKIRVDRLAKAVERDELGTLKEFDDYLDNSLLLDTDLADCCGHLGNVVQAGLLSIKQGRPLEPGEYENPGGNSTSQTICRGTRHSGSGGRSRTWVDSVPTLGSLLPVMPQFGIAAVIIREGLSSCRGHKAAAGNVLYRRMLDGEHPTRGGSLGIDPDQMNPIRANLNNFILLCQCLPIELWTTGSGVSSLLVFMGTGQGSLTREFLAMQLSTPAKMHFTALDKCISVFSAIETRHELDATLPLIRYENMSIYGQPSQWYTTHPHIWDKSIKQWRKLTLQEKFSPYFSLEVQRSWEAFLGPMVRQNPRQFSGPRKKWVEVIEWIVNQEIRGFMTGLGALQFANNMALAGVVDEPSPIEMAQWISKNKNYGAFAGLKVLNFNLRQHASPAAVRAAFLCFYAWLEHHLSDADKLSLHFGPIFVEQLLCKIGRWKNKAKSLGKIDLASKADGIFEQSVWKQGSNMGDHTQFPIPSCAAFSPNIFRSIVENSLQTLDISEEVTQLVDVEIDTAV